VYQRTKATDRVFSLTKRIRCVSGGTSSSKTISILIWLIDYAQSTNNKVITVVAESVPHLKLGAIRDFISIMTEHGYWNSANWNQTDHIYTFGTKTIIEFISFDKFGKAHGPRRDILFINECNNIPYNIADQLITRTRKIVWLDWNPSEEFWAYTELIGKRDDVDFVGDGGDYPPLTYLDCGDALDEITIKEIESHRHNQRWWTVYGEGKLGEVEGRIYTGWQIIDTIPHEARLWRRGLDFGYSIDPTVLIDIYEYNNGFILDERIYQKGLSNKSISDMITNMDYPSTMIIADSAEPKSIDEIASYGTNIIGAVKGAGSVFQGIQYVQDQKISITAKSIKTIKAYRNYMFLQDKKTGLYMNEPDDSVHEWSNPMDAIRYGFNGNAIKPKEECRTFSGGDPITHHGSTSNNFRTFRR
jgi:phage terminase large subunit